MAQPKSEPTPRLVDDALRPDKAQVNWRHGAKEDESAHLWADWQIDRNASTREQLIQFYLPFARMMAAKAYAKRTYPELEFMDYLQYASLGLIEALDRYDPLRRVTFETFGGLRISGAILNGIESLSEKQEQVGARKRLVASRVQGLKQPTPATDDPNAIFGYLAELAIGLALGFALEDTGMMQADSEAIYQDNTYQRIELKQMRQRMHHLLAALPINENRVLSYHYLQYLGFDEIAGILSLSKGRISQIHKEALLRLRRGMQVKGDMDLFC
jgi:RNA polymerase sigma factor for flagellar operon FliA